MKTKLGFEIVEEQFSSRPGKGIHDQILIQKMSGNVFDTEKYEVFWHDMTRMGFPSHIDLIKMLYDQQTETIRIINGQTDWIKIEQRVRQGGILSTTFLKFTQKALWQQHFKSMKAQ